MITTIESLVDLIYPVGSIYLSVGVDPEMLFPGTKWDQITDKYLFGASTSVVAGTTGGSEMTTFQSDGTVGAHTLTLNEMPVHTHSFMGQEASTSQATTTHSHKVTTAKDGAHTNHSSCWATVTKWTSGQSRDCLMKSNDNDFKGAAISGGTHTHQVTCGTTSLTHTHSVNVAGTVESAGGDTAHTHDFTGAYHTIMLEPSYFAIDVYKRIS